jgi:hypothetical protein
MHCFAEAQDHWHVSRIGAVVALSPLVTIATVAVLAAIWPLSFEAEPLSVVNLSGALLVVAGSMTCALGRADDDPAASMPEVSPELQRRAGDS